MKFRLSIGENDSSWGKQTIIATGEAKNAIEFCKAVIPTFPQYRQESIRNNAWVDAGKGTIPIHLQNLIF